MWLGFYINTLQVILLLGHQLTDMAINDQFFQIEQSS